MKKFIAVLMTILLCIGLVRYIAYVSSGRPIDRENNLYPTLNLHSTIRKVAQEGAIFDFSIVYIDSQEVQISFDNLTMALSAPMGGTYRPWLEVSTIHPLFETRVIYDTDGDIIKAYQAREPYGKPDYGSSIIEWVEFIGEFLRYIGNTLISIGELLLDVFSEIIYSIFKLLKIIVLLCFDFS